MLKEFIKKGVQDARVGCLQIFVSSIIVVGGEILIWRAPLHWVFHLIPLISLLLLIWLYCAISEQMHKDDMGEMKQKGYL